MADETAEHESWLSTQPDDVREIALEGALAEAKRALPGDEVAKAMEMGDDEAERALAGEMAKIKARDHREYTRFLASLPTADRKNLREIERKYGF